MKKIVLTKKRKATASKILKLLDKGSWIEELLRQPTKTVQSFEFLGGEESAKFLVDVTEQEIIIQSKSHYEVSLIAYDLKKIANKKED